MDQEQIQALDYLARKGTRAPVESLRRQTRETFGAVESAFDAVSAADRSRGPDGKWSAHEILDHLVLSHGPAIPHIESLLSGVSLPDGAIPAGLHRDPRPSWDELRLELGSIHARLLSLLDSASDDHSLGPKAPLVMVVKVGGAPKEWIEYFDWKAYTQAIRMHTMEHHEQLRRTLLVDSPAGGR